MEGIDKDMHITEKHIVRIQRKLQEGITNEKKIKYLKVLSDLPVTLRILKSTSVGKTVSKLRQDDNPICSMANRLIAKWKEIATTEKSTLKLSEGANLANGSNDGDHSERKRHMNSPLNSLHTSTSSPPQPPSSSSSVVVEKKKNASFEDMLLMPLYDISKKKKKKKKEDTSPIKLNSTKTQMPTLPDISLPIFANEPVYKPRRPIPDPPAKHERKTNRDSVPMLTDITSKKTRSQMYTGKRTSNGIVVSLYQQCMKVLVENIDCLFETGGVPFAMIEPILSKCTPTQLERLEYYNEYLTEDSDVLWRRHCQQEFKGSKVTKDDDESWKEAFKRLSEEREYRLEHLRSKISASQAAKVPERSVKLAYVAGTPKASSQMLRKQKRYGTGGEKDTQAEIRERMQDEQRKNADVAIPFGKLPRRERCSVRPPSSLSSTSRHDIGPPAKRKKVDIGSQGPSRLMPTAVKKPTKKPMMAAALKLMKTQKGRVNSQIMRR